MEVERIACPFECGYRAEGDSVDYQIMLHLETVHSEDGESPFAVQDDASVAAVASMAGGPEENYADCPVEGCGEILLLSELDSHVEMHGEEQSMPTGDELERSSKRIRLGSSDQESPFDTTLPASLRNLEDGKEKGEVIEEQSSCDRQSRAKAVWKGMLNMPDESSRVSKSTSIAKAARRRLGKSELGPHANEQQMPSWLVRLLKEDDGATKSVNRIDREGKTRRVRVCPNMMAGVIPVLERLVERDKSVSYAYFCDPNVKHVSKLRREGGFCGYRNIQMLSSYIIAARSQGHELFDGRIPSIFDIQEYVENAWDMGINAQGRVETGGIRGTRKYIGTPEAQAMFCSLNISCTAQGFKLRSSSKPAYDLLFHGIEDYFVNGCLDFDPKVRSTSLPPVYFQHAGHSTTIVGFEKHADGTMNLVVFDPMFHDSPAITKLIDQSIKHSPSSDLLKAYRRGAKYLKRYDEFEILKLTPPKTL